jgi:hypothetical protein
MKKHSKLKSFPSPVRDFSLNMAKVVGVILLGGFILGGLLTFGARYIRYEETGDLFKIGGNLKIEGTCDGCVPSGMVAMFAGSCPAGWTRFTEMDGRFPRGASTYGATGGSETHTHSGSTSGAGNHTHGISGPSERRSATGWNEHFASAWHNHEIYPAGLHAHSLLINAANHLPPYRDIVFCKKN